MMITMSCPFLLVLSPSASHSYSVCPWLVLHDLMELQGVFHTPYVMESFDFCKVFST